MRRRGAARRPRPRADRRVQGPLPRPPRRDLADRRHRPGPAADPRAARRGPTRPTRDGEPFVEVIMATNPTLEGEATAMYLAERLEPVVGVGQPDRPRPAGRRRPRVRRRGDPDPGPPGPAGGLRRDEQPRHRDPAPPRQGRRRRWSSASCSTWSSSGRSASPARSSSRSSAGSAAPRFILLVETEPDLRPRPSAGRRADGPRSGRRPTIRPRAAPRRSPDGPGPGRHRPAGLTPRPPSPIIRRLRRGPFAPRPLHLNN